MYQPISRCAEEVWSYDEHGIRSCESEWRLEFGVLAAARCAINVLTFVGAIEPSFVFMISALVLNLSVLRRRRFSSEQPILF